MQMPKLTPLPTQIKQKSALRRIYSWQGFIRKWELLENWEYDLPDEKVKIIVPKGFVFDGVSLPRVLHWFLSPTGVLFIPGMVHDFAYRYDYLWALSYEGELHRFQKGSGRAYWDKLFRSLGVDLNGMKGLNSFARMILYLFGRRSWRRHRKASTPEIIPKV